MTPSRDRRPVSRARIVVASESSPRQGELAPWASDQLRDNVVPEELRDQLVAEIRRWSTGRQRRTA
jgi:hypothetical protein